MVFNYDELAEKIKKARYCVILSGAGISTLSGIRDFRGKNGIYRKPETRHVFDLDVFQSDPSVYYGFAKDFIYNLDTKKPSLVHTVLAQLEIAGIIKAIITQNIDFLHQRAGCQKVFEVHGSPSKHYCIKCDYTTDFFTVAKIIQEQTVPTCPLCTAVLKPAITFFGEALPQDAFVQAEQECANADLLLVLGSSLTVYPAAALPLHTLQNGGELIIVNAQETPLDKYAVELYPDLEECFVALEERLL